MRFDIYDEQKLARLLDIQKKKSWDFDKDIDWSRGIDMSKSLLPLDNNKAIFPNASESQLRVISQLMGLIVASTISQLEQVACRLKEPVWKSFLDKHPVNPELIDLGEQFFEEEAKHARTFNRYIEMFASEVNVEASDLKKFLPSSENSAIEKIYTMNSKMGGMAMWWLISAVEEEAILFYHFLHEVRPSVDPLYYQIHRCHFEEEVRHKSYAQMMLEVHKEFATGAKAQMFKKVDFIIAEVLNMSWTFKQLLKLKNLKKYKNHHEFFNTLSTCVEHIEGMSYYQLMYTLFNSTPYISHTLHLSEHKHVNDMLKRYKGMSLPMPRNKVGEIKCTV
jgi:predicted metal-dependent hydrolase